MEDNPNNSGESHEVDELNAMKLLWTSFVIFLIVNIVSVLANILPPKNYSINLNESLEDRWKHVMLDNRDFVSYSHRIIR